MKNRTTLVLLAALLALGAVAAFLLGPARRDRPRDKAPVFAGLRAADVQRVQITRAGGQIVLDRAVSGWTVGQEKHLAEGAAVERLLADLAALEIAAVASTNPARQGAYELEGEKGIGVRLEGAGGRLLAAFAVGKAGPDFSSSYLRREGDQRVLLAASDLRAAFGRTAAGWREWRIVPFGRDEITAVRTEIGGARLLVDRSDKDGGWQVNGRAARRDDVERWLDLVTALRAVDFVPADQAGQGAGAQPDAVVTVEAGPKKVVISVLPRDAGSSQVPVRTDRSPEVYLLGKVAAEGLRKTEADFPPPESTSR